MDKQITAGEILGSVRTALKQYQAFEHLVKVVAFLEQQETYQDSLQKNIRNLEIEKAELEAAIAGHVASSEGFAAKAREASEELQAIIANRNATRDAIVAAADKEAKAIIDAAKNRVDGLKAEATSLRDEVESLQQKINIEKSHLDDLRAKYKQEKDRIIESLK